MALVQGRPSPPSCATQLLQLLLPSSSGLSRMRWLSMARRVISVRDPHAAETLSPPSRTTQQLQKPMLAAARPSSFSLLHHAPRWPLYCSCYGQACMGDIMLVCVFFPPLGCRYLKPIIIIQTRQSNYLIKQSICRPCCCILSLQMRLCREKAFQRCLPGANSFF